MFLSLRQVRMTLEGHSGSPFHLLQQTLYFLAERRTESAVSAAELHRTESNPVCVCGGELGSQDYFLSAARQLCTSGRVGASYSSIHTSFRPCLGLRTRCHCSPHYRWSRTSECLTNI